MIPELYKFTGTVKLFNGYKHPVEFPIMGLFQVIDNDGFEIQDRIQRAIKRKFGGVVATYDFKIEKSRGHDILRKMVESFPLEVSHAWKVKEIRSKAERQEIDEQNKIWICIGL